MTSKNTDAQLTATTLLKKDHEHVKKAFKEFSELGPQAYKSKKSLADKICKELTVHTQIEEEIFYPALRKSVKDAKGLVNEAQVEHDSAKELISQIEKMDGDDELFDAKVTVLSEYVNHHIKEEEEEMFPAIERSGADLSELAQKLDQRKQELV